VDSRISRTAGGVATSFKRAGAGQTSPVLSEIQGGSTSVRYLPGVYEDRSGTVTNYHSGIKNTFLQTNSAGSQTASKRYDAFGNVLASSGMWQGRFAYGGPHGYQTDAALELLGDRYYDPSLGRFLTRDVAKDGRNWYVYCGNNPLKFADDRGKNPLIIVGLLILGAYGIYKLGKAAVEWMDEGREIARRQAKYLFDGDFDGYQEGTREKLILLEEVHEETALQAKERAIAPLEEFIPDGVIFHWKLRRARFRPIRRIVHDIDADKKLIYYAW
jgi:RHS repeat-associated protein